MNHCSAAHGCAFAHPADRLRTVGLVLVVAVTLVGCDVSAVKGRVVDLAGQPVPEATLEQLDNPLETATDAAGEFTLPWLGSLTALRVTAPGYHAAEVTVGPTYPTQPLDEVVLWPSDAPIDRISAIDLCNASVLQLATSTTTTRPSATNLEEVSLAIDLPEPLPELSVARIAVFVDQDPHPIELFRLDKKGTYSLQAQSGRAALRERVHAPSLFGHVQVMATGPTGTTPGASFV